MPEGIAVGGSGPGGKGQWPADESFIGGAGGTGTGGGGGGKAVLPGGSLGGSALPGGGFSTGNSEVPNIGGGICTESSAELKVAAAMFPTGISIFVSLTE